MCMKRRESERRLWSKSGYVQSVRRSWSGSLERRSRTAKTQRKTGEVAKGDERRIKKMGDRQVKVRITPKHNMVTMRRKGGGGENLPATVTTTGLAVL